jgi:hypothetical protein
MPDDQTTMNKPSDTTATTSSSVTSGSSGGGGGRKSDAGMAALGELMCRLNPYTRSKDPSTGEETGDMIVGMLQPAGTGYNPDDPNTTIACMGIEVERNYASKWTFKGQEQSVKLAFRVPYRFPVMKKNDRGGYDILYWQMEYLIVGFAGADGGG